MHKALQRARTCLRWLHRGALIIGAPFNNAPASAKAADLRYAITCQYTRVLEEARAFQCALADATDETIARIKDDLRRLVSRRAAYTMLIRSRLKDDPLVAPLFD